MSRPRIWRALLAGICMVGALFGGSAPPAQGAAEDPLFVLQPAPPAGPGVPLPPPFGEFNGACGIGVDSSGRFYVSDYYHDAIQIYNQNANFGPPPQVGGVGYITQVPGIDTLDGPCGIAFDALDRLYVNDYHRAILRYGAMPSFGAPTTISGAYAVDETHPTGIALDPATGYLYVDERTYIAVFDEDGDAVMEGPPGSEEPLRIGQGSLTDGYGLALSQYPATQGYLYIPDAATNTVKVYDPATDKANPIEEINGSNTPQEEFVSLRDAAIAVDRVSGEVYLLDDLQPEFTERPPAVVHVFNPAGAYEGHLKYEVTDALPAGLAVDNSATATQGRVYVTSGNTERAAVYAYRPGSATNNPPRPSSFSLTLRSVGTGTGAVRSNLGQLECTAVCEEQALAGATVAVSATPDPGFAFAGWSGACSGAAPTCELRMEGQAAVRASFAPASGPLVKGEANVSAAPMAKSTTAPSHRKHHHRKRHHYHHHAKGHSR